MNESHHIIIRFLGGRAAGHMTGKIMHRENRDIFSKIRAMNPPFPLRH